MDKKIINIRLDSELWKEAKLQAIKEDKTLQEWITEAIQKKLISSSYSLGVPSGKAIQNK
jgi:predicted HicB family RNase H-like nuclease